MGRYDRQELLEGWDQSVMGNAKVAIIGMGRLGSIAAIQLACMGTGELLVVDYDTVEMTNLSGQPLYRGTDISQPKVHIAERRLPVYGPDTTIRGYTSMVSVALAENTDDFRECDVVLDCLDNLDNRLYLNDWCIEENVPLVSGGIYGLNGQLQIVTRDRACLRCNPLMDKALVKGDSCTSKPNPSIMPVGAAIASLQAMEAAKIIQGWEPAENFLMYYGSRGEFKYLTIKKKTTCRCSRMEV